LDCCSCWLDSRHWWAASRVQTCLLFHPAPTCHLHPAPACILCWACTHLSAGARLEVPQLHLQRSKHRGQSMLLTSASCMHGCCNRSCGARRGNPQPDVHREAQAARCQHWQRLKAVKAPDTLVVRTFNVNTTLPQPSRISPCCRCCRWRRQCRWGAR